MREVPISHSTDDILKFMEMIHLVLSDSCSSLNGSQLNFIYAASKNKLCHIKMNLYFEPVIFKNYKQQKYFNKNPRI